MGSRATKGGIREIARGRVCTILCAIGLALAAGTARADDGPPIKVGLVLDRGGRDDKSFNSAAFRGATEAQKKLGIKLKVVETSDDSGFEPALRTFSALGFRLVIGIGFAEGDPIRKVSAEFPQTHFLLIDHPLDRPNVRSVTFSEHEGSYLVGVLAALASPHLVVGFIGGMDIPLIRRFQLGYEAGAKSISPKVTVLTNYVGSGSEAWRNPTKAKELALAQFQSKADVIFSAAGASGMGVFDAAEETGRLAIGVDSNQNWVKPGHILTSMVKGVDRAVYDAIQEEVDGKFQPGVYHMGLTDGGVDFAMDSYNRGLISPFMEKKVNEIKQEIIHHQIKVPDYYELMRKPGAGSS
jgi:basic membrane protein A